MSQYQELFAPQQDESNPHIGPGLRVSKKSLTRMGGCGGYREGWFQAWKQGKHRAVVLFLKEIFPVLLKCFQKIEEDGISPNFFETGVTDTRT